MFGKKENQNISEAFKDIKSERSEENTKIKKKSEEDKDLEQNNEIVEEDKDLEVKEDDKRVQALEEENKKIKESLMRTLAELDNTRRRATEENEKTAKYAIGRFAEDLIPVMENFYLAFASIENVDLCDEKVAKNFVDGIKLTQNELKKAFEKNGLVRLFPLHEDFNPDLHNAIAQIESDEGGGKIVEVMQAGYKIKDRLLRPALVCVSKPKA